MSASSGVDNPIHAKKTVPDTSHDAAIAYKLQQAYLQGNSDPAVIESGVPLTSTPVYGTSYPQRVNDFSNTSNVAVIVGESEQKLLDVYSIGRGIKILASVDLVILLIYGIFNPFTLLFMWGPICGILGSIRHDIRLVNVYLGYCVLRILGDLLFFFFISILYIFSILVDFFIAWFVYTYASKLSKLTLEEVVQLRYPYPLWEQSRRYFFIF